MTTFMTFSVYSLRISTDMPVESNFVPMVTLYFILGISYTFLSFIWFIIANEFITKSYLPKFLISVASVVKRVLFWKFGEAPLWVRQQISTMSTAKVNALPETSDNVINKTNNKEQLDNSLGTKSNSCEKCEKEKDTEREKKKKKDSTEANVSALNHFMSLVMLLIVIACNVTIWLLISNPPQDF